MIVKRLERQGLRIRVDLSDYRDKASIEIPSELHGDDGANRKRLAQELNEMKRQPLSAAPAVSKGFRGVLVKVATLTTVVFLAVLAYGGIYYYENVNGSQSGNKVVVLVSVGDNLDTLANRLAKESVISSSTVFRIYVALHRSTVLQPGIYYFQRDEPYSKIMGQIKAGPSSVRLTIIPGWNVSQIASVVSKIPLHNAKQFIDATVETKALSSPYLGSATTVEGLLYPDTYFVSPLESDTQIIQTALDRFEQVAAEIGLSPGRTYNGLSAYQLITAASIVQKEATTTTDMAKVARVILNRLSVGMNLQMDSTVRYATGNFSGSLTLAQLHSSSPYNTYANAGLPPTPISEPSVDALEAVMHPAKGSWLYFVALKGHTSESFFNTFSEQEQAIAQAGGVA